MCSSQPTLQLLQELAQAQLFAGAPGPVLSWLLIPAMWCVPEIDANNDGMRQGTVEQPGNLPSQDGSLCSRCVVAFLVASHQRVVVACASLRWYLWRGGLASGSWLVRFCPELCPVMMQPSSFLSLGYSEQVCALVVGALCLCVL